LRRGLYQISITRHKVKATIHPAITAEIMKSIFKGFGLIGCDDGELVPFTAWAGPSVRVSEPVVIMECEVPSE
jgi:hypothetical protein